MAVGGKGEVCMGGGELETLGTQHLNLPEPEKESKSEKASCDIWKHGLVVGDKNVNHPVSDSSVSDFPTLDFSLPACNT